MATHQLRRPHFRRHTRLMDMPHEVLIQIAGRVYDVLEIARLRGGLNRTPDAGVNNLLVNRRQSPCWSIIHVLDDAHPVPGVLLAYRKGDNRLGIYLPVTPLLAGGFRDGDRVRTANECICADL